MPSHDDFSANSLASRTAGIVPPCPCQTCDAEREEGYAELAEIVTITEGRIMGVSLHTDGNGAPGTSFGLVCTKCDGTGIERYEVATGYGNVELYEGRCNCGAPAPSSLTPYQRRVALMRDEHVHKVALTLGSAGPKWSVVCPQEDVDYRCRHCSVGDVGCVLTALLDDGVDFTELLLSGTPIVNPKFPIEVTVHHLGGFDTEDVMDSVWVQPWTIYNEEV